MPIVVDGPTRSMSQAEFGDVCYRVMDRVFHIHNQMGPFFDERVYQQAIAAQLSEARTEVRIDVTFEGFCKQYFIDLLIESGAVFELKAVERLDRRHRAQLLNYLLLAELPHGKLVNIRPNQVEHEFVNTTLARADRIGFTVHESNWSECSGDGLALKPILLAILRDWGTALELPLYTEALTHFLGGTNLIERDVCVLWDGRPIGRQTVRLVAADTAFHITQIQDDQGLRHFEDHARRFLQHTDLARVQWINVTLHHVMFRTIHKSHA